MEKINEDIYVSYVIPVYGGASSLVALVERIHNISDSINGSYEIIFVCDQSPDNAWEVIKSLADRFHQVSGLFLAVNVGQHNAIMAGLRRSRGKIVLTMDDDLQHSPEYIPHFLNLIESGADVVYGRFRNRKHPLWKILGSKLNDFFAVYLLNKPKNLYLSPFRAFKSKIRDEILHYHGPYVYLDGLILSVTRNITSLDIDHYGRNDGKSNYGLFKSMSLWMKMVTTFSIVPLRITSMFGLLFSGMGFFLAILLIIQKIFLDLMPVGWSSLIVAILIIGGVQLLALGMIGEYLGRIFLTINLKPQYTVSDETGFKN